MCGQPFAAQGLAFLLEDILSVADTYIRSYAAILFMKGFTIAILITLASCTEEPDMDAEQSALPVAEIAFVERLTRVNTPVACAEFELAMGDIADSAVILDTAVIADLQEAVSKATPIADSAHIMDARLLAYLHSGNTIDTLCVGGYFGAEVNGTPVDDSAFIQLLWSTVSL